MDAVEPMVLGGRFRLDEARGGGGMAAIWRGTDLESGEPVAIKRLYGGPGAGPDPDLRDRLVHEADALRRLDHPNVVRYVAAGFDDEGQPYIVMEWLDGEDLESYKTRAGGLELPLVLEILKQALTGLEACHARGVVHRDIKPGNLFICAGGDTAAPRVKLLDLGVARMEDRLTRLTRTGKLVGTLYYLAPEQVRGSAAVDHLTDIYATGVVLYELATGRLPFYAEESVAVMLKIVSETPPWPTEVRPDLPTWLEDVILRAMMRAPDARFASAARMRDALSPGPAAATDPAEGTAPASPAEVVDHAALVDTAESVVDAARTQGVEKRLVTMLCVEQGEHMASVQDDVAIAVERHGGAFQRMLGRQAVGLFGLERTAGDEAARAVRAGLLVKERVDAGVKILASTIHVVVGKGLHLDSSELDQAARMIADLPAGQMMVDEATRRLLEGKLTLTPRGGMFAVSSAPGAGDGRRVLGVQTPTVGREGELAAARATLERAVKNREPEDVLVVGPAGIGKSRLLADLLPGLRERCQLCLVAHADASRERTPYSLLSAAFYRGAGLRVGQAPGARRAALESLVTRHVEGERSERVSRYLGAMIGLPDPGDDAELRLARLDPKVIHRRTTEAFLELLEQAGRRGPVCLCLDDLQWADAESLRLCASMLEALDDTPLLLLGSGRPELLERRPGVYPTDETTVIELGGLGKRAMSRLVRSILGKEVSTEIRTLLVQRSDGSPYFAEELISWLAAEEALVAGSGVWVFEKDPATLELPAGIVAAIQGRLDGLEPGLKELVKGAAVFGETFWAEGCQALGFAEAGDQLEALEKADFIVHAPRPRIAGAREWSFRHNLLRQVAYGMLPPERRGPLHLLAARWLEEVGEHDAALLAHHFQRGGDLRKATRYFARAGDRALAEGGLEQAVACYRASLEFPGARPAVRAERTLGLARAHYMQGQYDEAMAVVDRVDPLLDGHDATRQRRQSAVLRGQIHFCRARYEEAERVLGEVISAPDSELEAEGRFKARHTLCLSAFVQGRHAETGEIAEALFEMARQNGRPDHLCDAKLALTCFHMTEGDLSRAIALASEAVDHARELGQPHREIGALMMLGSTRELAGLYDDALNTLGQAHARAERTGSLHNLAGLEILQARIHDARGELEQAQACFHAAERRAVAVGDDRTLAIALAGEARTHCVQPGTTDLVHAADEARRALALVADRVLPVEAEARLSLARVLLAQKKRDEALEQGLAAVTVLARVGTMERFEVEILLAAHDALIAADRRDEAAEMLRMAVRRVERRARRIEDAAVRTRFLERVPYNLRAMKLRVG